jgi:transcriptional regulator with XRE-family HTH domain
LKKSANVVLFENLKFEMGKRHLSHADLAHRSGLSLSAVREITSGAPGAQSVNLEKLDRIASAFDLSAAQLLSAREAATGKPEQPAGSARVAPAGKRAAATTPKQLSLLIEEFFALPEADRVALLNTASDMASKYRVHITG